MTPKVVASQQRLFSQERKDAVNRRRYPDNRPAPKEYARNGRPQPRTTNETSTHCESTYLHSLMNEGCELVFVLQQGELLTGQLAWYDEGCIKVTPSDGSPSLLIPKRSLKYLYELREAEATRGKN